MTSETPRIEVESWSQPLPETVVGQLEKLLPGYIVSRRWYRAKAQTIEQLSVSDVIPVTSSDFVLAIDIRYSGDSCSTYLLPISLEPDPADHEVLAFLRGPGGEQRAVINALDGRRFRDLMLKAIACQSVYEGPRGVLKTSQTSALGEYCGDTLPPLESFVSRAEQSNTSVIYGDRFILKLFRKIESGINPDIEIGTFLTEHGFRHTPAVLGACEYRTRDNGAVYAVAILQQFVKNEGDAWKYTLDSLHAFFSRALALGDKPELFELANRHPLALMDQPLSREARGVLGDYLASAELLGKRTAQLHADLADPRGGPDFAPEPVTGHERQRVYEDMLGEARNSFETLRRKQPSLGGPAAESARQVLELEAEITARFFALRDFPLSTLRIRHHGDYHLGQVLFTGEDFMIIDFEGEPARPLSERRSKALAVRDVAGMVRSFEYAAFAALFGQIEGVPSDAASLASVERWAAFWNSFISAAYLRSYFAESQNLPFVPASAEERRIQLDAFVLQKALYEVSYELNNRPDWVRIPLRGILTLMRSLR
ncbi:MAG: putative maltokinase [Acidobacteriaceae bacterium]|nr:putative maltokinase [Acidobacteriaceae bacterium]